MPVDMILSNVNRIRTTGCFCGEDYAPPTHPLKWNKTLHRSALLYARDMSRNNYFSHYSQDGKDVGERLLDIGYHWLVIGENLGVGQKTLKEVLQDWKDSPSHCKMLMDPRVVETGLARHGKYWVQHFGKPPPAGAVKRGSTYYIVGTD